MKINILIGKCVGSIISVVKILTPVFLLIGLLSSFNMFTWHWYIAGVSNGDVKAFYSVWALVMGLIMMLTLLSWVAYAITLWRRKGVATLGVIYLCMWVVMYSVGLLWVNYFI